MKFSIDREILLNHLNHIQKGLPNKTPLPILNAIKFEVFHDYIRLTANNSDIAVQCIIEDSSLKINQTGRVAINGKLFIEIIRKINANTVDVELVDEKLLIVKAQRSEFKLKLFDVDDYPEIDFLDNETPFVMTANTLKTIIKETNFAAATSEKRPILTGVNFRYDGEELTAVATDSYRLSQRAITIDLGVDPFSLVIPKTSLDEIAKILDVLNEEVHIYINPNKVLFKFNNLLFQTRLLEGAYPETSRIIPTEFVCQVTFNKEELLSAVEQTSILSPKDKEVNYNIVKLYLRADKIVELSSNNQEVGNGLALVSPSADVIGTGITIAFSSKQLIETLRAFSANEVILSFAGEVRPFIIKDPQDDKYTQLILPVRVD